jgi:hypothetical protein
VSPAECFEKTSTLGPSKTPGLEAAVTVALRPQAKTPGEGALKVWPGSLAPGDAAVDTALVRSTALDVRSPWLLLAEIL